MSFSIAATAFGGCHLIDCVEDVPVTRADLEPLSCETLWVLRNSIFAATPPATTIAVGGPRGTCAIVRATLI